MQAIDGKVQWTTTMHQGASVSTYTDKAHYIYFTALESYFK